VTINELRGKHPFPWRYAVLPTGVVSVQDAVDQEVPLFTLLDFVCAVTNSIQNRKEAA